MVKYRRTSKWVNSFFKAPSTDDFVRGQNVTYNGNNLAAVLVKGISRGIK